MADVEEFKIKKKKLFKVQCPFDKTHVFDKVFELEEGVDSPPPNTTVETFCPFCSKMVEITVKGEAELNQSILRKFEEQDKRLGIKRE
jgi:hypothetical protein